MGALAESEPLELSIYDIQYTTSSSGNSPYRWDDVTITGTVTARYLSGFVVAEEPGAWHAIFVYSRRFSPDVGDEVELTGMVYEYYKMTQITYVDDLEVLSSGNTVESTVVSVGDVSQEAYESVLVSVEDVFVSSLDYYGEWQVSDGTDYAKVNDLNDYAYFPQLGDDLDSLTGVVFYSFSRFKIEPRETSDITGDLMPHYALHGTIVTMNENRDVHKNSYLEILGDEIIAIHSKRPKNIRVVDVGGLIFPGLIDAHNHASYGVLDTIPFNKQFNDRYEWRDEPVYDDFQDQLNDIWDYGGSDYQWLNAVKLTEVRALTAGTTAIQGDNCNGDYDANFAHQGIIINNVERFPTLAYHSTFPLWSSDSFWANKANEYWERFIVHIAEGTSADSLDEFYYIYDRDMIDERTTIIHGVPLGDTEWEIMGDVNANLVWSPASNLALYGATADIPGALEAGVNVALGPDWTESGSHHLLDELKEAHKYNKQEWDNAITPQQFAEFVTCNAATAVGAQDYMGQITPGYRANLMVIPGGHKQPYKALLHAEPEQVKLTVVDGIPRYGNPDVMAKFGFLEDVEEIMVGGVEKSLAIQVYSHAIWYSNKPFAEILEELEEAYFASEPKVCEFVGLE
jgi:hypothetical protein